MSYVGLRRIYIMQNPTIPSNEEARLRELQLLDILDTLPEEEYDEITQLASQICEVPVSLISLIDKDRQWFKSAHGTDSKETPRDYAFCAHAINTPNEIFEIPDARLDERFHDNPLVANYPNIVFYTGVPLVSSNGNALGTLCVIDNMPKKLDEFQKKALEVLSRQVVKSLELRNKNIAINKQNEQLKYKNSILKDLAQVLSHDLKTPLNNIIALSDILANPEALGKEEEKQLNTLISQSANNLKLLIDDVLTYAASENPSSEIKKRVSLTKIVDECKSHFNHLNDIEFEVDLKYQTFMGNPTDWKQIIFNLVSNAVKYNDKAQVSISISSHLADDGLLNLVVSDNGIGIPEKLRTVIFMPFKTLKSNTRNGEKSSGIGLATIDKIISHMKGKIDIQANKPHGTVFNISVPVSMV